MKYYIVEMNGSYMNCFTKYTEAREYADWLRKRHINNDVRIIQE